MLSIINCITEPYLLQSYIFTYNLNTFFLYAHVFTDWKVIVPVPDYSSVRHLAGLLAYGSSSGRLPAFAVTFLSFVPNITIWHLLSGQSHNYSRGSCGGFSPHFPGGFYHVFPILNRLFSRCCKFSVELLKGYHFFNDLATPFFHFSCSATICFFLWVLSLQQQK